MDELAGNLGLVALILILGSPVIWAFISTKLEKKKAGFGKRERNVKRYKTQGKSGESGLGDS